MQIRTSSTGVSRAVAAQYARIDALRQIAVGPLCPLGGVAAVDAGSRQLYQPRVLRWLLGAHPCALVRAGLPLRASGRGHPGGTAATTGWGILVLDAIFVPKSGDWTWGLG